MLRKPARDDKIIEVGDKFILRWQQRKDLGRRYGVGIIVQSREKDAKIRCACVDGRGLFWSNYAKVRDVWVEICRRQSFGGQTGFVSKEKAMVHPGVLAAVGRFRGRKMTQNRSTNELKTAQKLREKASQEEKTRVVALTATRVVSRPHRLCWTRPGCSEDGQRMKSFSKDRF